MSIENAALLAAHIQRLHAAGLSADDIIRLTDYAPAIVRRALAK